METGVELIVELREGRISQQHCSAFIHALKRYRDITRGNSLIERELAWALHLVEITFIAAFDSRRFEDKERDLLSQVHQEFVLVMMDILIPEANTDDE